MRILPGDLCGAKLRSEAALRTANMQAETRADSEHKRTFPLRFAQLRCCLLPQCFPAPLLL